MKKQLTKKRPSIFGSSISYFFTTKNPYKKAVLKIVFEGFWYVGCKKKLTNIIRRKCMVENALYAFMSLSVVYILKKLFK